MGTLLSMQVPFVMFGALKLSEHFLSHGVFILLNMLMFVQFIKSNLSEDMYYTLLNFCMFGLAVVFGLAFLVVSLFLTTYGANGEKGKNNYLYIKIKKYTLIVLRSITEVHFFPKSRLNP